MQVREVHGSKSKVQEQAQEVHNSKDKFVEQAQEVQEQVQEGQEAQEVQELQELVQEGSAPGRDPRLPPARGAGHGDAAPHGRQLVLPYCSLQ